MMTLDELDKTFSSNSDEYLEFNRIENKFSQRPDLHAFLLLDKLVPGNTDIVSAANHDEIFVGIDVSKLVEVITKEQIIELVRCGVSYDGISECLSLFT